MNPLILSIATANPSNKYAQSEIARQLVDMLPLNEEETNTLQRIYDHSAIQYRYSVLDHFCETNENSLFWNTKHKKSIPSTLTRNQIYKEKAPELAYLAAQKAINAWGGPKSDITHIISISCTGVIAPGLEFQLLQRLELSPTLLRLGINMMGCFGAFKGLQVASAFAKENPNHRILVVCTELCSLHFQQDLHTETILANALFADGAAAVIVGSSPRVYETPLFSIIRHHSLALEKTLNKMTWEVGDHGFFMHLSPFIPSLIKKHISAFVDFLLQDNTIIQECNWAIHPGGKSILEAIERELNLSSNQTEAARNTLFNYGNMSSATFLFVLEDLLKQSSRHEWSVGLGFGPGLSFEGILLKNEQTITLKSPL